MRAGLPVLSGAVQETRSESVVRGSGTTARSVMAAGTLGLVLGELETSKTAESPYMGRVALVAATSLPSMGSWTLPEALSRPMRTLSSR